MADKKFHALVCCRAGMGSSMMLKIKIDQVIKENDLPIETEHGNLDSLIGFNGDLVITMSDLGGPGSRARRRRARRRG